MEARRTRRARGKDRHHHHHPYHRHLIPLPLPLPVLRSSRAPPSRRTLGRRPPGRRRSGTTRLTTELRPITYEIAQTSPKSLKSPKKRGVTYFRIPLVDLPFAFLKLSLVETPFLSFSLPSLLPKLTLKALANYCCYYYIYNNNCNKYAYTTMEFR